ncbi:MAG: hypothetical protein IJU64_07240 [Bacilli bacterium]|nr:hypothetical protein [Bacilli bacterium]
MSEYFEFLRYSLKAVFVDMFQIGFNNAFINIGDAFNQYSRSFGIGGWTVFVIMLLLLVGLIGALFAFIIYFIRHGLRNKAKKNNEKAMMEEIERLNLELYDAVREKDKIIGMNTASRTSFGNGGAHGNGESLDVSVSVEDGSRFTRLINVDAKYNGEILKTSLPEDAKDIDLKGICERFRYFACSQMRLYYTIDTVRQFFAAMGTGKLIILEGISGTGKTSLPYCLGRFFKNNANICSVQPSWRDRSELLGYYNDFTHKFTETEFLRAVYEATYRDDNNLIVLDEMNLARIEYYFAEFLSIMEMPNVSEWNIDLIAAPREDDPKHLQNGKLLIPQNIFFIGTANNDDSTFTITDKVYDRAMSLFFDNKGQPFEAPYTEPLTLPYAYLDNLFAQAKKDYPISQDTLEKFAKLDDYVIEHFKLAFGNRIMKQLNNFVPCFVACGGTELDGIDYVFKTKILKKFEVLNVAFLRDELAGLDAELTKLFGKNEFPLSRDKIRLLIKMSR